MSDSDGKQNLSSYRMPESWWRTLVAVFAATSNGKYPQRSFAIIPFYTISAGTECTEQSLRGRLVVMAMHGLLEYTTSSDNKKSPRNYKLSRTGLKALDCWENASSAGCIDTIIARDYLVPNKEKTKRYKEKTKKPAFSDKKPSVLNAIESFFKLPAATVSSKQKVTAETHPHLFRGEA
ncbi:hypothetical protein VSS37_15175 [Candidatus Thiothrix sp. Deng01]|uniref:Uncharacterized protein n=1 Tax=Candidatus Thiothrix phosphatis TaxID=3112415 RepID=A0ABU6D106_9GAMM|nr:hypothetical protein [Candidatus Thiothrix sp. Deng01]MEB4592328.1 hypothetical protein [Candidatus Thiothrix sp. Deng01]